MDKNISIIGFGNQAKAWALNLRDSGYRVFIGLRPQSASVATAKNLKFDTFFYTEEELPSQNTVILAPDDTHGEILGSLKSRSANLIFAHGYSLHYHGLSKRFPEFNCLLLAPKAIASEVRLQYEIGGKIGALYSVEYSSSPKASEDILKTIAKDVGISSLFISSSESETKADLFSEQSLLCSVLPYAALYSFNKLIQKGINEETAYFECWHEVKLIADTMVAMGPQKFFELISPNALVGSEIGRKALFDKDYFEKIDRLYESIDSGDFAQTIDESTKEDFKKIKEQVVGFWKKEPLNLVHQRLAAELY